RYVPTPASRSRRPLTVEVHVACCTRCPYGDRYVPVSGALVALADGFDEAGAPPMISFDPGCRHASTLSPYPGNAPPWQGCCSSQNTLNLSRGLACTVRRSEPLRQLPA